MNTVPKKLRNKKTRLMGDSKFLTKKEFEQLQRGDRIALIRRLIPIGLMAVAEELQKEVDEIMGQSVNSETKKPNAYKYGSNPGSVVLGNQRIPIRVPRIRTETEEISLES